MYIYLSLVSALGWGIAPVLDRLVLQNLDYLTFTPFKLLTRAIFGIILALVFREKIKKNIIDKKINAKVLLFILASGTISFLAGLTYYKAIGLNNGYLLNVAIISHILPIVVIGILTSVVFKKKITKGMILGMVVTFIGIYITIRNTPN